MSNIYIGDAANEARKVKNIYIGDADNIARKVIKGWVGDENNIARLFYTAIQPSIYTISAIRGYVSNAGYNDYETLKAGAKGSTYCQIKFDTSKGYDSFTKAILHLYVKSSPSTLTIFVQKADASNTSASAGWGNDMSVTGVAVGWMEIDITELLKNTTADSSIADIGCKINFRSSNGNTIIGGNKGEYAAYLVLS